MFENVIFYCPATNSVVLENTPNNRGGGPVFVIPRIGETIATSGGSYIVVEIIWNYEHKTIRIICKSIID